MRSQRRRDADERDLREHTGAASTSSFRSVAGKLGEQARVRRIQDFRGRSLADSAVEEIMKVQDEV